MKAVISKIDLVNLIGKIQSIVAAKPAIPILSNVLIEAIDDQLIVSATDLTVSMRCYVEAKVVEDLWFPSVGVEAHHHNSLIEVTQQEALAWCFLSKVPVQDAAKLGAVVQRTTTCEKLEDLAQPGAKGADDFVGEANAVLHDAQVFSVILSKSRR